MKTITVLVDKEGNVQVEVDGYVGNSCQEATKKLIEDLGLSEGEQLKPEFYQEDSNKNEQFS